MQRRRLAPPPRSRRASRPRRSRRAATAAQAGCPRRACQEGRACRAVQEGRPGRSQHHEQPAAGASGTGTATKTPASSAGTNAATKAPAAAGDDAAYEAFDQGKYITALELALKAAGKGDPQAHTLVGRIYADGLGTSKNLAAAAQWYARGAELGDTEAMFAVAVMLAEGQGVQKDRTEAARLFEMAAARKHPLANYNLALLFLTGEGKPENPYRAAMHMRFAAESGVVVAQYDLGTLYATGTGVEPNAFEAAKWIGKAADCGAPRGAGRLRRHAVPRPGRRRSTRSAAPRCSAPPRRRGSPPRRSGWRAAWRRVRACRPTCVDAAKWHLIAKSGGLTDEGLEKMLAKLSKADRSKGGEGRRGLALAAPRSAFNSRHANIDQPQRAVMRSFIQRAVRATPPKL